MIFSKMQLTGVIVTLLAVTLTLALGGAAIWREIAELRAAVTPCVEMAHPSERSR